jgi:hypothetical protein
MKFGCNILQCNKIMQTIANRSAHKNANIAKYMLALGQFTKERNTCAQELTNNAINNGAGEIDQRVQHECKQSAIRVQFREKRLDDLTKHTFYTRVESKSCTIDLHEMDLCFLAGWKKRRDDLKNMHSKLVSKFCTIDLREMDLCFLAGQGKRRDELKYVKIHTRVWVL